MGTEDIGYPQTDRTHTHQGLAPCSSDGSVAESSRSRTTESLPWVLGDIAQQQYSASIRIPHTYLPSTLMRGQGAWLITEQAGVHLHLTTIASDIPMTTFLACLSPGITSDSPLLDRIIGCLSFYTIGSTAKIDMMREIMLASQGVYPCSSPWQLSRHRLQISMCFSVRSNQASGFLIDMTTLQVVSLISFHDWTS